MSLTSQYLEINWPPQENREQTNGLDLGYIKTGGPPTYNFRDEVKHRSGTLNRETLKK